MRNQRRQRRQNHQCQYAARVPRFVMPAGAPATTPFANPRPGALPPRVPSFHALHLPAPGSFAAAVGKCPDRPRGPDDGIGQRNRTMEYVSLVSDRIWEYSLRKITLLSQGALHHLNERKNHERTGRFQGDRGDVPAQVQAARSQVRSGIGDSVDVHESLGSALFQHGTC